MGGVCINSVRLFNGYNLLFNLASFESSSDSIKTGIIIINIIKEITNLFTFSTSIDSVEFHNDTN